MFYFRLVLTGCRQAEAGSTIASKPSLLSVFPYVIINILHEKYNDLHEMFDRQLYFYRFH